MHCPQWAFTQPKKFKNFPPDSALILRKVPLIDQLRLENPDEKARAARYIYIKPALES